MKPIDLNPEMKIGQHIDALFGNGIFERVKSNHTSSDFRFQYSKRTGRIKYFFVQNELAATLRTDGGISLTLKGANELLKTKDFLQNCVVPISDVIPYVRNGGSLFCRHVEWCGSNVRVGSEAVVVDRVGDLIAVGRALIGCAHMKKYGKGVAVKIREALKSPSGATNSHDAWGQSGDETNVR